MCASDVSLHSPLQQARTACAPPLPVQCPSQFPDAGLVQHVPPPPNRCRLVQHVRPPPAGWCSVCPSHTHVFMLGRPYSPRRLHPPLHCSCSLHTPALFLHPRSAFVPPLCSARALLHCLGPPLPLLTRPQHPSAAPSRTACTPPRCSCTLALITVLHHPFCACTPALLAPTCTHTVRALCSACAPLYCSCTPALLAPTPRTAHPHCLCTPALILPPSTARAPLHCLQPFDPLCTLHPSVARARATSAACASSPAPSRCSRPPLHPGGARGVRSQATRAKVRGPIAAGCPNRNTD